MYIPCIHELVHRSSLIQLCSRRYETERQSDIKPHHSLANFLDVTVTKISYKYILKDLKRNTYVRNTCNMQSVDIIFIRARPRFFVQYLGVLDTFPKIRSLAFIVLGGTISDPLYKVSDRPVRPIIAAHVPASGSINRPIGYDERVRTCWGLSGEHGNYSNWHRILGSLRKAELGSTQEQPVRKILFTH